MRAAKIGPDLSLTREQFSCMSELWPISQRTAANPAYVKQPSLICTTADHSILVPRAFRSEIDWRHVLKPVHSLQWPKKKRPQNIRVTAQHFHRVNR